MFQVVVKKRRQAGYVMKMLCCGEWREGASGLG
jgi:hypothetical protein